jgi:hypothetical protein
VRRGGGGCKNKKKEQKEKIVVMLMMSVRRRVRGEREGAFRSGCKEDRSVRSKVRQGGGKAEG